MRERWDCIFVGRIERNRHIFLTDPAKYGLMGQLDKIRKSLPRSSSERLMALAIATEFNKSTLLDSEGLVVRKYQSRVAVPGLQSAIAAKTGKGLRKPGSTEWLAYISPSSQYFKIIDNKIKGGEITGKDVQTISSFIEQL